MWYGYNMETKNKTYIYALMDDTTVKYIGKSDNPNKQKLTHISETINGNSKTHKSNWINKMVNENKEIGLKILETVNDDEWEEKEKYWINHYGLDNLTNATIGGLGNFGEDGESNLKYEEKIKRTKNLKITPLTHKLLKEYCDEHGLKMFAFVEKIIKEQCKKSTDLYGE